MAQMRPYLFRRKDRFVVLEDGKAEPARSLPVGTYKAGDRIKGVTGICKKFGVSAFQVVEKEYGYIAEPGQPALCYVLADTQADVARQLIDRYYSQEEALDADERGYKAWLHQFIGGRAGSTVAQQG